MHGFARNMPYELYGGFEYYGLSDYTFSVTLGSEYDTPELSSVQVDMTSEKTGETFRFDETTQQAGSGLYFNVDTEYYGIPKCIIFDANQMFDEDDVLSITVSGITKNGEEAPISYDVRFFSLNEPDVFYGDIDGDGDVGIVDIILLHQYLHCQKSFSQQQFEVADMNDDGKVNVIDMSLLKKQLLD